MPHPDVFTPAQACAVMQRPALRLSAAGEPLRPSVTAEVQMIYDDREKGTAGTHEPHEAAARIRLQALATGLAG